MTLFFIITQLFVGMIMATIPYIARKNLVFGVTLPETALTQKLKKQFALINAILCLIFIFPLLAGNIWLSTATLTLYPFTTFLLYLFFHGKTKQLKPLNLNASKPERLIIATDFRQGLVIPNKSFALIMLLIILITTIPVIFLYDRIPDYIPTHWGFDGQVTTWRPKSLGTLSVLPITQLLMVPIFLFANHMTLMGKQALRSKVSLEQNRAYRKATSRYLVVIAIATLLIFAFLQFATILALENLRLFNWFMAFLGLAFIIYTFRLYFKYGQSGERYKPESAPESQIVDDDAYWKLGAFYYNPKDSAIFIEKRFGMGMTCNWARWQSWAFMGGLLVVTVVVSLFPFWIL